MSFFFIAVDLTAADLPVFFVLFFYSQLYLKAISSISFLVEFKYVVEWTFYSGIPNNCGSKCLKYLLKMTLWGSVTFPLFYVLTSPQSSLVRPLATKCLFPVYFAFLCDLLWWHFKGKPAICELVLFLNKKKTWTTAFVVSNFPVRLITWYVLNQAPQGR